MKKLLFPIVVLTAGLIALGGSSAVSASSGSKVLGGQYVGRTSQGEPISFLVGAGQVVNSIQFTWKAKCADGTVRANVILLGGTRLAGNTFSTSGSLNTGGVSAIAGVFQSATASGSFSRTGSTSFGVNCTDNAVGWTARVKAG
jgi:hypothetical protein